MKFVPAWSLLLVLLAVLSASCRTPSAVQAAGQAKHVAKHVVVLVWDGMRPDFITPSNTPTLAALASNGVFFAEHHSVYCSATEVNATAIATGSYPSHSGIIVNNDYLPAIRANKAVVTTIPGVVRRGDELTGGNFIQRPTIAETLQAAGRTTAIAGAKTVGLLHDRHPHADPKVGPIFKGDTLAPGLREILDRQLDEFPEISGNDPNKARDEWTRKMLTDVLWTNGVPDFSLLWLSEPDHSQHHDGPGSPRALKAIKSSDDQLAAVLAALEQRGALADTDIFIVSDHGFSTITHGMDVAKRLQDAGFKAAREYKTAPQPGNIMVVGQGGSVMFFVIGHDADVTQRLVQFLQQQEFAGVIFTRDGLPGTFPLSAAMLDRDHNLPDVALSMRWDDTAAPNGTPGALWADGKDGKDTKDGRVLTGTHASLSRFDLHNTLVAAGPDFKRGFVNSAPSGNVDVAPTVLAILGVKPLVPPDGRVLREVFVGETNSPAIITNRLTATVTNGVVVWQQQLQTRRVNNTVYLDEGSAEPVRPQERP